MSDKQQPQKFDDNEPCPKCGQPMFLEDCTPGKCNSRYELDTGDYRKEDDEPGHNQFGEAGYWVGDNQ